MVTPKTVNSIREIPFLGEMEEILKSQKKKQNKLKEELGSRWRSTDDLKDLVFTTGMGSPCVRYVVEKEIKKALKDLLGEKMLDTHIRQNISVVESTFEQKPVIYYKSKSNASKDYIKLAKEVFKNGITCNG